MEEEWRDIEGYEGRYQISNLGNVKSLNYMNRGYEQNLIPKTNNQGRLWVELFKDNKRKPMLIHRLVAMAFIPNPDNLPQINHKDENPKNNCVSNLEWCTAEYNYEYSKEKTTFAYKQWLEKYHKSGEKKTRSRRKTNPIDLANRKRKYSEKVIQLRMDGTIEHIWENLSEARRSGLNQTSIYECCIGKRHSAYGYKWEFAS